MVHKSAICTMSLGRCYAGHSMSHKLDMAAKYGFRGIEVFYEDLVGLTDTMDGGASYANQISAANTIRYLCSERGLKILCLQPLMHYGGLVDREQHKKQLESLHLWIRLAHALETDMILFPSSFLPQDSLSNSVDAFVHDMTEAADIGLRQDPVIRFAHEALCWGTQIDTWEVSWEVTQRVDRPNFGICLDTFNIAGRVYADPASQTGLVSNGHNDLAASLNTLVSAVDLEKLFLVQVADAERLPTALDVNHPFYDENQPARMSWSRNCRLFYGEEEHGAYLPVRGVLSALINDLGFQGWLSFEIFNRRLAETGLGIPEEMASRAAASWEKMARDIPLRLETHSVPCTTRVSAML